MEPCSIKNQKIQAMKSYKRAKIVYNLVLYTLTSIITCFFFSSPFWFPSISTQLIFSSIVDKLMLCFNAKCFFVVGNLIVFILIVESKLKQSSSSTDIYEEYVARSRSSAHHKTVNGSEKTLVVGEKIHLRHEEKKDGVVVMRSCKSQVWGETEKPRIKKEEQLNDGEKIKVGLRSSKSVVWGENGMVKSEKIIKGKKKDGKVGTMRSSKSAVWGEGGMVKTEKAKGKKEEALKTGMSSSKSAVWGESEMVKMEKVKGKKEEKIVEEEIVLVESEIVDRETTKGEKEVEFIRQPSVKDEEKKMGMRSSRSAVWGKGRKVEEIRNDGEEKKMGMGMRSCRSEIWSEGEIVRLGKVAAKEEEEQQINMLNKRVEDFIARVNKQRLIV
ncbi:golgin subfamily A member 6-like protein 1 [Salvia hispanica]|uniref:golgin subfamily A member 6-like protein 1 n=1 Tax=Salvia hispanica TaxID=49212 RepID=UPI002009B639|nr:golgin subfamily A member 6-like protein 1 [Salvia hispanica]